MVSWEPRAFASQLHGRYHLIFLLNWSYYGLSRVKLTLY